MCLVALDQDGQCRNYQFGCGNLAQGNVSIVDDKFVVQREVSMQSDEVMAWREVWGLG